MDLEKPKAEELLPAMVQCLAGEPLTGFDVVNRCASFTTIRVLATITNALAYTQQIEYSMVPSYSKDAV